jgi:hypothetical protein
VLLKQNDMYSEQAYKESSQTHLQLVHTYKVQMMIIFVFITKNNHRREYSIANLVIHIS